MDEILAAAPATVVHIWRQLEERLGGEGAGAEEALPRRAALADPEHVSRHEMEGQREEGGGRDPIVSDPDGSMVCSLAFNSGIRINAATCLLGPSSPGTTPQASSSFEAARDTFNEGMTWYKRALERLQLNGWVTDHFGVQLECSAMFRWLKEVEGNIKRKIAMDKERARRLEPILNTINVECVRSFGVASRISPLPS